MAIVIPLILLLVFGVIEFGVGFNQKISLNQGVRESARAAAVANYNGGDASCTGAPAAQTICLTKKRAELGGAKAKVVVTDPNGNGVADVGENFVVCGAYPLKSMTGLFSGFLNNKFLHSKVVMRIEQQSATFDSAEDAPLSGDDWAWCTT
jgi:Flp pilus assembly protein TadG